MVNDHCVVHGVHLLMFIEPRLMNEIVLGSTNFIESPIDELNTTLKLRQISEQELPIPFYSTIEPHHLSPH